MQSSYVETVLKVCKRLTKWRACACNADIYVTSWADLPIELEEVILARLSLPEFARVSWSSRKFQAFFNRQMAREQKARCDLAVGHFGRERILRIGNIADHYHCAGETAYPQLVEAVINRCWISADGTLHLKPQVNDPAIPASSLPLPEAGDLHVTIELDVARSSACMSIKVEVAEDRVIQLRVIMPSETAGVYISIHPDGDDDVMGLALVQALLCGDLLDPQPDLANPQCGLGPPFWDSPGPIELQILPTDFRRVTTPAGVLALIAPLLPLTSLYEFEDHTLEWAYNHKHHVRPRCGGSSPKSGIAVRVSGQEWDEELWLSFGYGPSRHNRA
jgi:hypothetical protein